MVAHNTVKYYIVKTLWMHETVTKTTVDSDETGSTSSSLAWALNTKPVKFNVVAVIFIWALKSQWKDKWNLHRPKLLGSMSFPMLLGHNVAPFGGRRERMERTGWWRVRANLEGEGEKKHDCWTAVKIKEYYIFIVHFIFYFSILLFFLLFYMRDYIYKQYIFDGCHQIQKCW